MLLPRYSLRTILVITAVCAVISLIVAEGLRGRQWAAGIAIGMLALLVTFALGALFFGGVWVFANLRDSLSQRRSSSASRADARPSDPSARSSRGG